MYTRSYTLFCIVSLWAVIGSCTKEKKTESDYPRVAIGLVTDINSAGATFNGSFLQAGDSEIIDHGFVYDDNSGLGIQSSEKISLGPSSGKGSFTARAGHSLKTGETYYVSAYARNKDRTFYAEPVSFVSKGGLSPEINSIVPYEGLRGDTVTIHGKNFSGQNNIVSFGDQKASVISSSETLLKVLAPTSNGIELVDIFVTTAGKTTQRTGAFRYLKPVITSISPTEGVNADLVEIKGKWFGYPADIFFGEMKAFVVEATDTLITAMVPEPKTTIENTTISILVDEFKVESSQKFRYLKPIISSFEPQNACGGDTVTIKGLYLKTSENFSVSFGSYSVEKFVKISDTEIKAVVPYSSGQEQVNISVTNIGLTGNSDGNFRYLKPEITSITPDKGLKGDLITINGKNFGHYVDNFSVYFGDVKVSTTNLNPIGATVSVPKFSGLKQPEIWLVRDGISSNLGHPFQYHDPVITGFSPASGKVGTKVTITGQYFSNDKDNVRVTCGDFELDVESCSNNQIIVTIPNTAAATKQPIVVSIDGIEGSPFSSFEIISPWTKKATQPADIFFNSPITWTYNNEGFIVSRECWKYSPANDLWQLVKKDWDRNYSTEPLFFQIGDDCFWSSSNDPTNLYQTTLESLQSIAIAKIPQLQELGSVQFHSSFSFVIDDKAYVCGGHTSNSVWQFDAQTKDWTKKASLPGAGRNMGIAFSYNGKGYAGWGAGENFYNDFFEYEPQTDTWTRKADFPQGGIANAIVFKINNRIFAGLGISSSSYITSHLRDIWEYNPVSDSWNHVTIIPNVGGEGTFVFVINNKAYIGGGRGGYDLYEFDLSKL